MIHNLFSFHGADHKVGTTMVAQSVAEIIAGHNRDLKVLFLPMNGRESTEYTRSQAPSIDSIKTLMRNQMINRQDFLRICKIMNNLYMLAGITNELEERHYIPEMAIYLLEEVAPEFDLVIADCGNTPDNGLAAGALQSSCEVMYLITQQESILNRCEKRKELYHALGIKELFYLVNKYCSQNPYTLQYLEERLQIKKNTLQKIEASENAERAETDHKTLIEYHDDQYRQDVFAVANLILTKIGCEKMVLKRKFKWKNFI